MIKISKILENKKNGQAGERTNKEEIYNRQLCFLLPSCLVFIKIHPSNICSESIPYFALGSTNFRLASLGRQALVMPETALYSRDW